MQKAATKGRSNVCDNFAYLDATVVETGSLKYKIGAATRQKKLMQNINLMINQKLCHKLRLWSASVKNVVSIFPQGLQVFKNDVTKVSIKCV